MNREYQEAHRDCYFSIILDRYKADYYRDETVGYNLPTNLIGSTNRKIILDNPSRRPIASHFAIRYELILMTLVSA